MKVTMILPALTEATSPFFRPIKYSLFPPLGLATLAGAGSPTKKGRPLTGPALAYVSRVPPQRPGALD